jgi:preprotein translocase subunit SecD
MTELQQCFRSRAKKYPIYISGLLAILFLTSQGAQEERDTVVFILKAEEINSMKLIGDDGDTHWIDIILKRQYHADFASLTGNNIGNVLMITFQNEVYARPVIISKILGGRFMLGPFESNEEAMEVFEKIQKERKQSGGGE